MQANIARLDCIADATFDSASCLFSTFGMLVGPDARKAMLAEVRRILKPGGVFILHVHNLWFNLHTPLGRSWLLGHCWRAMLGKEPFGDRVMPAHQGNTGLTLHLFRYREIASFLAQSGFILQHQQPLSLKADGQLSSSWLLPGLRAYGYLITARKG